jgi:hypothetical protein
MVRSRLLRVAKAATVVLAAGCIFHAMTVGGTASAGPAPSSPSSRGPEAPAGYSAPLIGAVEGATGPATLALQPARGAPGAAVDVTGDWFASNDASAIEVFFDGQLLAAPTADASGHFDITIKVPADARAGAHTARGVCDMGSAVVSAGFTVVPVATITPTTVAKQGNSPPSRSRWNFGWLLLVISGGLAAVAYWHRHNPRGRHDLTDEAATGRNPGPGRR